MSGPEVIGPGDAPVAICTLADELLRRRLIYYPLAEGVMIRPLNHEPHGVEMLAETLLRLPHIRVLAVVGESPALRRLFAGESTWPNLTAAQVEAVRQQVRLIETTEAELWETVRPYLEEWLEPGAGESASGAPAGYEQVAAAERCFDEPDPAGYVIISLTGELILATHYTAEGRRTRALAAHDSESLAQALAKAGLIGRFDHALYIGRELMKAEVAQRLGLPYVQDEPLQLT